MQLVAVKAESRIENNYTSRALVKPTETKPTLQLPQIVSWSTWGNERVGFKADSDFKPRLFRTDCDLMRAQSLSGILIAIGKIITTASNGLSDALAP